MTLWRRHARDDAPSSNAGFFDLGPSEGEVARKRAELALEREMERTAMLRAETPAYLSLGARLKSIYETNHIRADIAKTMRSRA